MLKLRTIKTNSTNSITFGIMINFSFVKDFLSHRINAKTRHGIHSPFVYQLVDEVIYDLKPKSEYKNIEELRKKLISDERFITVTDLGAGSHVNNNKKKQVKQIAVNALKPTKLAQLIYRLVQRFKPHTVIELGTCLGTTTAYMATAKPDAEVITMEGCPETAKIAAENFAFLSLNNITLKVGNFDENFPELIAAQEKLDFVFIDGNHRKDATLNYFEWCLPKVHENTVLIFDDIYWSDGMKEAWQQIKNHSNVTCTVDLFWIGLVFFRKGIAKEHFKIKY